MNCYMQGAYMRDHREDDSPFMDAYRDHRLGGGTPLACRDLRELDELLMVAHNIIDRPAYADDTDLIAFRDAIALAIDRKTR